MRNLAKAIALVLPALVLLAEMANGEAPRSSERLGPQADGSHVMSTRQRLTPYGVQLGVRGQLKDVAMSPNGRWAAVLGTAGRVHIVDAANRTEIQTYAPSIGGNSSAAGIAYSPDGSRLFLALTDDRVQVYSVNGVDGRVANHHTISLPTRAVPNGLAVTRDGRQLAVVLNGRNSLGIVDLGTNALVAEVPVGNAPSAVVLSADSTTAYVTNQGGRRAGTGDFTVGSFGTPIVADPTTGASATGTVSVVSLASRSVVQSAPVELQPTAVIADGNSLYVANTNSDSVSVLDRATLMPRYSIPITPFAGAPKGSSPNALALVAPETLAVSLGANNAVALYRLPTADRPTSLLGLLPTGFYPTALTWDAARQRLLVVSQKGLGTWPTRPDGFSHSVSDHTGGLSFMDLPPPDLAGLTAKVARNNAWDSLDTECINSTATPVAIPAHIGEPSLIKHVIYIIKENRTYDQVLGDVAGGNGDPRLTMFGESVTPNQHALAREFVLLDNFYVAGTVSADGHQWATQAMAPDYVERAFPAFARSYPFDGGDALAYLPSGFIWQNAVQHGKRVRVYGEYARFDRVNGGVTSDVPSLRPLLDQSFPAFDLTQPDDAKATKYIDALRRDIAADTVPNLSIILLPGDHTAGAAAGARTPRAYVADNDLAVGRIVDAVSHSSIWPRTAVFIVEDDAQAGLDHVDGHRTTAYVASPYARRGVTDSTLYNQVSVIRTIEQILGLPPMNQMDAASAPMRSVFVDMPDHTPFSARPARVSLTETNPGGTSALQRAWSADDRVLESEEPDEVNDQFMNRSTWYAATGFSRVYPGDDRMIWPDEFEDGEGDEETFEAPAEDQESEARPETATARRIAAAQECAGAPQLRVDPVTVVAGSPGTVSFTTATPPQSIRLYAYSRPSTSYALVRDETRFTSGDQGTRYTATLLPRTNTRMYVVVDGQQSESVVMNVRQRLSLAVSRETPQRLRFSGSVFPARAGQAVSIRYLTDGGSVLCLRTYPRADGSFSVSRTFTGKGVFTFVAGTAPDMVNAGGASPLRAARLG